MNKKVGIIALFVLLVDQLIKGLISSFFILNTSYTLIPKFLYLTYCHNNGAAFNILSGNRLLLCIIALAVIIFLYLSIKKETKLSNLMVTSYGLIIGNFFDRLILGYVIDYIDIYIFKYNFPVFNLADSAIVIGVFIMLITSFKEAKK